MRRMLVKWHGEEKDDATWPDEADVCEQFPHFGHEDRDAWKEGVIDTTRSIKVYTHRSHANVAEVSIVWLVENG